ncbi:hypothetical protein [Arcanobacterium hippocoleae]|uniref:Uncharacterized protein n=1 Tax=Arcanobacterium hippocoleae TaxID=149017 RepID=A0ABU1T0R6_9ACTO|nr:hypothetical protein [Arcanobacterium hippocoleae]MDR6938923.1 hypothetical protein [Arcanobacterium hippocoleae]
MGIGDYYIAIVIGLLIGGAVCYGLFAIFSGSNSGYWDSRAELIGKLRAKKYTYREYGKDAAQFLLHPSAAAKLFLDPAGVAGIGVSSDIGAHDLISNSRGLHWRSCGVQSADGRDLYFTCDIPQRPDGKLFSSPEILFIAENDAAAGETLDVAGTSGEGNALAAPTQNHAADIFRSKIAQWNAAAPLAESLAVYQGSDFAHWIEKMRGFKAVHIIGANITLAIEGQGFDAQLLEIYPKLAAAGSAVVEFLPQEYWQ